MSEKIEKFKETIDTSKSIVFCVQCGSTKIDQNSSSQLRCYSCDNVSIWDSGRFSIAREGSVSDVKQAFEPRVADVESGDWSTAISESLLPFLHRLSEVPSVLGDDELTSILEEDLEPLMASWDEVKTRVDAVIQNLLERK